MCVVHVAVAAIINAQGQVLLARRPEHVHQGGLWEFPGGKLEPGENSKTALIRELDEELGLVVKQLRPLIQIRHDYVDKSVRLHVWLINAFSGLPVLDQQHALPLLGREGQPLCWVKPESLVDYALPAANRAIVQALRLPQRYLITPDPENKRSFLTRLQSLLQQGVQLLRLRAWNLDTDAYYKLAQQVLVMCRDYDTRLMLSIDLDSVNDISDAWGADGVHLNHHQLMALSRRPVSTDIWLAASCHNSAEISRAGELGVDFICLSPLRETRSHAHTSPLGWQQFQYLLEQASMPVYALGGMTPADNKQIWECGGQGMAAISSLWNDRVVEVSRS